MHRNGIQIPLRTESISSEGLDSFLGAKLTLAEFGLISASETF